MKRLFLFSLLSILIIGCNTDNTAKITASVDGGVLTLAPESNKSHNVKLSIDQLTSFSASLKGG